MTFIQPSNTCHLIINALREENVHFANMNAITVLFLSQRKIAIVRHQTKNQVRYNLCSERDMMNLLLHLSHPHTYLHTRQLGVEIFGMGEGSAVIKVGERPPTSNQLSGFEEVYFKQYLPDHSLHSTRLVHTIATVIGVAMALFALYSGRWYLFPLGILAIYEAGFHSHLFIERNTPLRRNIPLNRYTAILE